MANKTIGALTPTAAVVLTDKVPKEPTAGPPAEYFLVSQLVTLLNTIYAPITGGAYVLKAGDTMTGLLQFSGTGHYGLRLNNLTTAQRDAIGVGSAGNTIWNTTTGRFDMNIGGSWKNFVRLDGDTMSGMLTTDALITYGGSGILMGSAGLPVLSGFRLQSFADGNVRLANFAGTGAGLLLQLGGLSAAEPAIRPSGAVIQARLANDSAFTEVECSNIITNNAGAAFSTNTTLTNFAAAALGTLTNSPTAGNPAKWCAFDDNGTTRYFPTWI